MNRPIEFSAALGTNNVLTGPHEVRAGDRVVSVQFVSTGTGANIVFEASNNGVNWVGVSGRGVGTSGGAVSGINGPNMFAFMVQWRFWRLRSTAGSGTCSGVAVSGNGWTL